MAIITEFYKRLRALCEERGMTINEMVKILDLSSGSPTAWKKGATPRNATLSKIADYFGVTTEYLLGNDEQTEKAPAVSGERAITMDELKVALFRGRENVTDAMVYEVLGFADLVALREDQKKKE